MYSNYLRFAVDSAWQSCSFDSKFDSVSFEGVTIGDAIGECSISFSKGRSVIDGGIPFLCCPCPMFELPWKCVSSICIVVFESQL